MKPKSTLRSFLLLAGSSLLALATARADSATWNVDVDGNWVDDASWNPATAPGATTGTASPDVATFGNIISAARAIAVDANRNIAGIDFAGNSSAYNLSGGGILLTNGGTIQTSGGGSAHTDTIASPIEIQGDGGAAFFTGGSSTATRLLAITGGVTGVSTGTNVTTLTLNGTNTGNNTVQGGIGDGTGGGKLALVKDGAGSWNLSNADNSYSGGTTINAGTLTISTNGRLGDAEGDITFGGNAKLLAAANNVTLAATRTVTVNSGVAVMGDNNINNNPVNFTVDGRITGDGGLQVGHYQLGSGITNLNSTENDFAGPLILGTSANHNYPYSTFTLNLASLADGESHGNIVFGRGNGSAANTATLNWSDDATSALVLDNRRIELDTTVETSVLANNSTNTSRTITVNTDLLVSRAGNKVFGLGGSNTGTNTYNTVIADSVAPAAVISLTKSGAGRWILTQPNTYTGTTTVSGGVLVLNNATSLPGGLGTTGGTSNLTLNGGAVGLATGDFTRGLGTGADQVQFTGGVSGFGAYGAPRTVTINDDSNFELVWGSATFNPASLALNVGNGVNNSLTLTNKIDLAGASRTIQTTINTGIVTGVIRNSGVAAAGLTKTGSGTLQLNEANTYNGATTVNGGLLRLENATAIPGGLADTGGLSNVVIGGGQIGLTAASGNFNRPLGTGAAQARFTNDGGFAAFGGTRNVQFSGSSINWTATNFIGTGNTLILGHATADGTLNWQQAISTAGGTRTVQIGNGSADVDAIMSGTIAGGSSGTANGLTKTGAGTLALASNSNSHWGPTTVSAGTLTVGNGGASGRLSANSATINIAAGATLAVNRNNDVSQEASGGLGNGSALISGDGNFAQIGSGTTTLSLANTYTGTTTVNAGTLVITGATQATSSITVAAGGTLGLDIASPVTASSAAVTLTGPVLVTGTPGSPSHTLLTAASISPVNPALAAPVPGYSLQVVGNELRLVQVGGSPYLAWSGGPLFEDDTNNDGVDNGLAWIFGAANPAEDANGLLPVLDNTSDPDYFIFTYRRADAADGDPNTTIAAEYGTTLGSWTTAVDNADIDIIVTDNHYSASPGVDRVEVKLKRSTLAPGGRLFARVKGTNTP